MTDRELDLLLNSVRDELAVAPSEAFVARLRSDVARRTRVARRRRTAAGFLAIATAAVAIGPDWRLSLPDVPGGWGADRPAAVGSPLPTIAVVFNPPEPGARPVRPVAVAAAIPTAPERVPDLRQGLFDPFGMAATVDATPVLVEPAEPVFARVQTPLLFESTSFPVVGYVRVDVPASDRPGVPVVSMVSDNKEFK